MTRIKCDNVQLLTAKEVAEQWLNGELGTDEYISDAEWDGDIIAVSIAVREPLDPRIDGHITRYVDITLTDIRRNWTAADYYTWAKDENGEDVLACFGC